MMLNRTICGIAALGMTIVSTAAAEPLYHTDFKDIEIGEVPDDMLVFDGNFEVKEFEGKKIFELPGSPLETFGFLFGPNIIFTDDETKFKTGDTELKGFTVTARAQSAKKGRRYPTYSIGVCGVSGYRLRNSPAKRAVELVKGEETVATMSYKWPSDEWTEMKLQIEADGGKWVVKGKFWRTSETEPFDWQLTHTNSEKPNPGKASAWAAPYSGQPIRFGELKVEPIE